MGLKTSARRVEHAGVTVITYSIWRAQAFGNPLGDRAATTGELRRHGGLVCVSYVPISGATGAQNHDIQDHPRTHPHRHRPPPARRGGLYRAAAVPHPTPAPGRTPPPATSD